MDVSSYCEKHGHFLGVVRLLAAGFFTILFFSLPCCSQQNDQITELVTLDDREVAGAFVLNGFFPTEGSSSDKWRWGMGSSTEIYFYMDAPGQVTIVGSFENPYPGQSVTFELNRRPLQTLTGLPKNENKAHPIDFTMEGMANQGRNTLVVSYGMWNGKDNTVSEDTRNFSVKFRKFTISRK